NCGGASSTVIDWLDTPTCSLGFNPTVANASTSTFCCVSVWNPAIVTVTLYSPGCSGEITNNPASVVLRAVCTPVSTLVAMMEAPATTAPVGSVTVPWMVTLPATWAVAAATLSSAARKQWITRMVIPPTDSIELYESTPGYFSEAGTRVCHCITAFNLLTRTYFHSFQVDSLSIDVS